MTNAHEADAGRANAPETDENHGKNWDEVYDDAPVWSGNPNQALVDVLGGRLADLPTGRALDVGCGEGADAVLLASRGWRVTALDVSAAALERGRLAAETAGHDVADRITWVQAGLLDSSLAPGLFTLVSVFYPALRREQEGAIEASLASLVAPGGVLLMVAHAHVDRERAKEHGFDPDLYVTPDDIARSLPNEWTTGRYEATRDITEGAGAHHHEDVVIIARRPAVVPGSDAEE